MAWQDMGNMGDVGNTALAGLDDSLAELNDTFGELEGFDALAGSVKIAIPVVVGGGVAFGTAAALDYFIEDEETKESVLPYKWLIGAGVSVLAGLAMYKFQGPAEGVATIAAGLVTSLAGWGMAKLQEPAAETDAEKIARLNAEKAAIQAAWRAANPTVTDLPADLQGYQRYRYRTPAERTTPQGGPLGRIAYKRPALGNMVM